MASHCRKFVPNPFNKTKCKSCFAAKESHSAEALESSKAARKISKCAYLFVAPDLDFSNPLQRTKRWQRRFFVLYDDGELTYSVDDNPSTVPQGSRDMNKCTDVFDAESHTGHEFSIGIEVPTTSTLHVKGENKEEIRRWFDVLVMFPRSLTKKVKKGPGAKNSGLSRHNSFYPVSTEKSVSDDEDGDSVHSKDSHESFDSSRSGRTRGRYKQRDIRRSKSEVRPADLKLAEDEYNRKSSREGSPAFALSLSTTGKTTDIGAGTSNQDKVDGPPPRRAGEPETFTSVRSMKHKKAQKESNRSKSQINPEHTSAAASGFDLASLGVSDKPISKADRRLSTPLPATSTPRATRPLTRTASNAADKENRYSAGNFDFIQAAAATATALDANETDEHKIAKSEHARKTLERAPIVRKGWLVKQDNTTQGWSRHWFVLCGTSLTSYQDAKAEENNQQDGVIDVGTAYEVANIKAERNHGFVVKTADGNFVLSAMTSGIRRNWVEAIESIISELRKAEEKSAREDMGFVFEPPVRVSASNTPAATSTEPPSLPPGTSLTPVVPNSSSRINTALREMAERRRETGDDTPLDEIYESKEDECAESVASDTDKELSSIVSRITPASISLASSPHTSTNECPSPKSPSAFVSPSQRIKEKSRAKTPPRRSPPPPSTIKTVESAETDIAAAHMPSSGSSDENDDSLNARLLESQKQVQRLQQQCQDVTSTVRKQRVEIESLQTKVDLTTSQLHDMETALTHSAQNLNKERKHVSKLTEAMKNVQDEWKEKYIKLEKQFKETSLKLANHESLADSPRVHDLQEELKQSQAKNITLEKLLTNTRKHLQNSVDQHQDQQLVYETRIEGLESDFTDEKIELTDKITELEEKLAEILENSAGRNQTSEILSVNMINDKNHLIKKLKEENVDLRSVMKDLNKDHISPNQSDLQIQAYIQRISSLQSDIENLQTELNDMKTHTDNLQSENLQLRDKFDEIQAHGNNLEQRNTHLIDTIHELEEQCKSSQQSGDNSSLGAENWQIERAELTNELESVTLELNAALESSQSEITNLRITHSEQCKEIKRQLEIIHDLKNRSEMLEREIQKIQTNKNQQQEGKDFNLEHVMGVVDTISRSAERMTESAVAMLQGEMIETDIKVTLNLHQNLRNSITSKSTDQMKRSLNGVRQRLNFIVKNSTSRKQFDKLASEKESLEAELASRPVGGPERVLESPPLDDASLTHLLNLTKVEISNLMSDLEKGDKEFFKTKLQTLILNMESRLQASESDEHFTCSSDLREYASRLGIQAAAMFEMARACQSNNPQSKTFSEVEILLKTTSGSIKTIHDLSIRSYASLVTENLLLTHELHNLSQSAPKKLLKSTNSKPDIAALSLASQALYHFNQTNLKLTAPSSEASIQNYLTYMFNQNRNPLTPSQRSEQLIRELEFLKTTSKQLDEQLQKLLREHVNQYGLDLLNFGVISIGDMEGLCSKLVDGLRKHILDLCHSHEICELSEEWVYVKVCKICSELSGIGSKGSKLDKIRHFDLHPGVFEVVLKLSLLEVRCNCLSSLIQSGPSINQALEAQASNLVGLSADLYSQADSQTTENQIGVLACRLMENERLLNTHSIHYGDAVQEVMKDVVHSLHLTLLRYNLTSDQPKHDTVTELERKLDKLKIQLKHQKHTEPVLDVPDSAEPLVIVGELKDEIDVLKVEHCRELEESKRDMRTVLKSVKSEEQKIATELTEEIAKLRAQLQEERRQNFVRTSELELSLKDSNPTETQQLKQKVKNLENCLHELQADYEEDLYQERMAHQEDIDKLRHELLETVEKIEDKAVTESDIIQSYQSLIHKLESEQEALQRWVDDMRASHQDVVDSLIHENERALNEKMTSTQAEIESMKAAHDIKLEEQKIKLAEAEERAATLTETGRKLLLETKDNETKESRINSLEKKISTVHRQLAKHELDYQKQGQIITKLQEQNQRVVENNKSLVDQFSSELSKLKSSDKINYNNAHHMRLSGQISSLTESLKMSEIDKQRLEERIEQLQSKHELEMRKQEEQLRLEMRHDGEEVYKRRLISGTSRNSRSPSPSLNRRSSPSLLAASHDGTSFKNTEPMTASPRRLADKQHYDLSRSKSASHVPPTPTPRIKTPRLSASDFPESPNESSYRDAYYRTGGTSLAERMRRFKN